MRIAIIGATSRIASDFIKIAINELDLEIDLYSRKSLRYKYKNTKLKNKIYSYKDFINTKIKYNAILNFIGLGNPKSIQLAGSKIIEINNQFDDLVINYLKKNPKCCYVYISSGAVHGTLFENPINDNAKSIFPVNQLENENWYGIAKFISEIKHRMMKDLFIVDIRIYNYFSSSYDINDRFLITDIIRSINNRVTLRVSNENIKRDFIGPNEIFQLISKIIKSKKQNVAIDCYSRSPVNKFNILNEFKKKFNLEYSIENNNNIVESTGKKLNYYSISKKANKIFGYKPKNTSIEILVNEYKKRIQIK